MNRTQKFALNSFVTALSQIIIMLIGFIVPSLKIRIYGSEMNGLVSSITQMISYITLVEAGLSGAAVYSLYKPLAEKNVKGINAIISAAKKYYFYAGYIFSAAAFILAVVYALLKSTATIPFYTIFFLTLLLSVNGCVDFFVLARYRVILTADQKTYVLSTVSIIQTIMRNVIIIVSALMRLNLVLLYALALLPVAIKVIFLYFYCKKNYSFLKFNEKPDIAALGRRYDVIYQQILSSVQLGAPMVIATIMLDWFAVSIYAVYNMVLSGINSILSIFISGLPAGFGEVIAKGETETLKKSTAQFEVAYYYILTIVYGLTFVLILPFIKVYTNGFTDANYYQPALAFFIVLNGLLYNIKVPQSMLIISAGMYKEMRWRATIQAGVIIIGGFALAPLLGLNGIMIASCLSNIIRTVDLLFFVPKNITHNKKRHSMLRMLRVLAIDAVIVLPTFFIDVTPGGYFEWLLYAIGFGIYAVIITTASAFIFDRENFGALMNRMKGILRRK